MTPEKIQSDAQNTAITGTVISVIGGVLFGVGLTDADAALAALLGAVLLGVGQFLVLRSLVTWAVSKGTEPLLLELTAARTGADPAALAAAGPEAGSSAGAAVHECTNRKCVREGEPTNERSCDACGRHTFRVRPATD